MTDEEILEVLRATGNLELVAPVLDSDATIGMWQRSCIAIFRTALQHRAPEAPSEALIAATRAEPSYALLKLRSDAQRAKANYQTLINDQVIAAVDEALRPREPTLAAAEPTKAQIAFQRDWDAYTQLLPLLLEHSEGKYALIVDGKLHAVYETYELALAAGYRNRGLEGFIAQKIEAPLGVAAVEPKFDADELAELTRRGAEAWKDVPNASEWVESMRGNAVEPALPEPHDEWPSTPFEYWWNENREVVGSGVSDYQECWDTAYAKGLQAGQQGQPLLPVRTYLDQIDAENDAREWLNGMLPTDNHKVFWQWEAFSFAPHLGRVYLIRAHEKPIAAALIVRDGLNRTQVLKWQAGQQEPDGGQP